MRAVITGVAGFVGSHLADALLADGHTVVGIDCFTPFYDRAAKEANIAGAVAHPRFTCVEVDLRDTALDEVVGEADVVFHQAAQPGVRRSWADGFEEYVSHNVLATQRLLEAVSRARRPPRVVYASSSSVYGNQPRYPVHEDAVPQPCSPYGVTKLAAEHLCTLYAQSRSLPIVSLRYFTVFGPRQRPDMAIARLCDAALAGTSFPRFGSGAQVREFTYVSDIVAANLAAAAADVAPGTTCNIAGGAEITLNALITLVGDVAGTRVVVDVGPALAGDALRNGGATERAASLLGWEPQVSLRSGIEAQVAWHRLHGSTPRPASTT